MVMAKTNLLASERGLLVDDDGSYGQQAAVSSPGTRVLGGLGALGWIQWRARPSYGSSSSHDDESAFPRRFRFICD